MEQTKTYQYRKVTKPLLERKRRARINKSLDQLKDLMVECLTQEGEHIVRLEKADILELTVDYLRKLKSRPTNDVPTTESFRNGYINAANEVSRVLASTEGVDITLGKNVMTQLGCRLHNLQQQYAETVEMHTSTEAKYNNHQQHSNLPTMCPLKIDMPMSPASSGYHSDMMSPTSSEESFAIERKTINESVWRPW